MVLRKKLFEFVCGLIDRQIEKYDDLARIGIGPDALFSAQLTLDEVVELLDFAKQLMKEIKSPPKDNSNLIKIFNQVKFYLEQEVLRFKASWLLDENNIHSNGKERVEKELEQLKTIAGEIIDFSDSMPLTDIQKQCQYNSAAIAFYILNLVKNLNKNSEIEQPSDVPKHAWRIIKLNASAKRYDLYEKDINDLHEQCEEILQASTLEKTPSNLMKEQVHQYKKEHKRELNILLMQYGEFYSKTQVISKDNLSNAIEEIHSEIPHKLTSTATKKSSVSPCSFFGKVMVAGALLSYLLMEYVENQLQNEATCTPINLS